MERLDPAKIERLIINTVTMLCKNSLSYSSTLHVQGTIGITVDAASVILIQLNECFECGADGSHRTVPGYDGIGNSENVAATSHAQVDAKRPRMSSVVQCTQRPVGHVRGRVPVPRVRGARSRHMVIGRKDSAQGACQRLAFPNPTKRVFTKPHGTLPHVAMQHVTPPSCKSAQFSPGHVPASLVVENAQQLPVKSEVVETTRRPVSSDIICVESDDDTESAVERKPRVSNARLNSVRVKSEGQSQDALQMIVDRALLVARATNAGMVRNFLMLFDYYYHCYFGLFNWPVYFWHKSFKEEPLGIAGVRFFTSWMMLFDVVYTHTHSILTAIFQVNLG